MDNKKYTRDSRSPIPGSPSISRTMSKIKGKNTIPELVVRKALRNEGMDGYRLHWKKAPGRPDICYPGRKIAIFVNGCFWHRCKRCNHSTPKSNVEFWNEKFTNNIERDKKKIQELEKLDWTVFVIWECQTKDGLSEVINKIKAHYIYER